MASSNTMTCEANAPITMQPKNLIEVHSGLSAILPAGATITEIHMKSIGDSLTPNRAIAVGNELNNTAYTGQGTCGIPTNALNKKTHVSLYGYCWVFQWTSGFEQRICLFDNKFFLYWRYINWKKLH